MPKTFIFDIDGTICPQCNGEYGKLKPYKDAIKIINKLYNQGNKIIFYTSRFMGRNDNNIIETYKQGYDFTLKQLKDWGFKFHELHMGKPRGDIIVDDKNIFFRKSWVRRLGG